jgi:hypothetical protein
MGNEERGYLIVNETPHYLITIQSYSHLLEFAEADNDIEHPLGGVYRTKVAHPDNMVRIVVLRKENNYIGLLAYVFDKAIWLGYRNPFSPDYNATRTLFDDNMGILKSRMAKVYRPVIASVIKGVARVRGRVNRVRVRVRNIPRVNKNRS